MDIDLNRLLALPAAERLELSEILQRSVGCPGDIETLWLPEWRRVQLDRLLERYVSCTSTVGAASAATYPDSSPAK